MTLKKTNISTYLVACAIGVGSRDVGTLCTSDRINPWSKYKPVNLSNPTPDRNSNWWMGDNGRCGFNIGILLPNGSVHKVTKLDDLPLADWHYDKVTTSNPKRLADFGGYNPEAVPAIMSGIETDEYNFNKSKGEILNIYFDVQLGGEDNLGITNFPMLNDYYYAAAIKGPETFGHWREFRGSSLADSGGQIGIDFTGMNNGTYDCILFASTSNNPELDGNIIPLPSNSLNKTSFRIKLGVVFSFDIVLDYVSRSSTGSWTYIDDIPWYDPETGKGGYKCPRGGTLYFKGRVVRTHEGYDSVNTVDMKGESESFHGGFHKSGLHNCITDLNGNIINTISTPGASVGDYKEIIVKWSGYTGQSEPEDPQPIGGGLSIYSKTAYLGGSNDFDLVW